MPITESQKKASYKYHDKNIKRVPLDMQITDYELLKQHVTQYKYQSLNGFIKSAINEKIEHDRTT